MHTIFEAALSQNRPSSEWVYDRLEEFFPCKTTEQLVYFSNVLCLSISGITSPPHVSLWACVHRCCHRLWRQRLPPLENYLHEGELEAQDVCIHCIATIKQLGVWLHQVDMTTHYNEARANSLCSEDHKLGALLNFLLAPENTSVGLKHIIDRVVAENVDALKMHLIKSKKLLKEASKSQTKLLTWLTKQKMTLEKIPLSKNVCDETSKVLSQTTEQLDQARTTVTKYTADIVHIEALLKDYKSTDEESSFLEESAASEPGVDDDPPNSHSTGP